MSTFTLAISCLTTSNLPWFMDLTFQVPMQQCSLQHRTLLLSPVPFTTECCFCFGSIPLFFLELLLHWSPGYSLEGLILTLKLQYFGYLMWRADSFEKTLMLGKIEGRRRRGQQRMRWLDGITNSMDMGWVQSRNWGWTGRPGMLRFMGSQRVGHD